MNKRRELIRRYVTFLATCTALLLIGVILSIPIRFSIDITGNKPPFLFHMFFSIMSLVVAVLAFYGSYLSWFQPKKYQARLTANFERMAKRYLFFRLPIYNPVFLFWLVRLTMPIAAVFLLGLFLLVLLSWFMQ